MRQPRATRIGASVLLMTLVLTGCHSGKKPMAQTKTPAQIRSAVLDVTKEFVDVTRVSLTGATFSFDACDTLSTIYRGHVTLRFIQPWTTDAQAKSILAAWLDALKPYGWDIAPGAMSHNSTVLSKAGIEVDVPTFADQRFDGIQVDGSDCIAVPEKDRTGAGGLPYEDVLQVLVPGAVGSSPSPTATP